MKQHVLLILSLLFSQIIKAQEPPPPVLGVSEHYTRLWSSAYDYQSNGSVKYFVQDPANSNKLCAILMAQPDSTTQPGTGRHIYYSYSEDQGNTWTADVLDVTRDYGFPCMTTSNGIPVIACDRNSGGIKVFKDLFFGAFGFSEITGIHTTIQGTVPQIAGTANGNIVMVATSIQGVHRTTYNGSSWSPWVPLQGVSGPASTYCVEANSTGTVGIFSINFNENNSIKYFKSDDNGITFDTGITIFNYLIDGIDTLYTNAIGGMQAVYKGNEPHLAFTVFKRASTFSRNPITIPYIKPKILLWSPLSGVSQLAGKFNIPTLADTITTSLMAPLCQPSIGVKTNGELVCSFTVFLKGNTQVADNGRLVNAGEIFRMTSLYNVTQWIIFNSTWTPTIEEKHSSVNKINRSDNLDFGVYFLRDMKAGNWVQNPAWGKAPVYGIFKNVGVFVGIHENNSEPNTFKLSQNYPNPFNPNTIINYQLPALQGESMLNNVILKVYDILGNEIATIVNEKQNAGSYSVEFDGSKYASGIYFYKLVSGNFSDTKKMIILK